MMPLSRLDCPLSLKTPNMGNPGLDPSRNGRLLDFPKVHGQRAPTGMGEAVLTSIVNG